MKKKRTTPEKEAQTTLKDYLKPQGSNENTLSMEEACRLFAGIVREKHG